MCDNYISRIGDNNTSRLERFYLALEKSGAVVNLPEIIGEDKTENSHELHDDVEGRSRGVLEGISNSIPHYGSFVNVRSLTFKIRIRRSPLNVLLGVVPGSSGVTHGDGKLDGGDEGSDEEAGDGLDSEEGSGEEGGEHDHGAGGDHLPKGGAGGDLDAGIVVRAFGRVGVEEVGLLLELPGDLHDHLHGGKTDRFHGHRSEPEGDHSSDDEEGKGEGLR